MNEQNALAWRESLKPGDEVAIPGGGWGGPGFTIATVSRLTATRIVVGNTHFNKKNGYAVGAGYRQITKPTPALREKIEVHTLTNWLRNLTLNNSKPLPLPQLRAMKAAHDAEVAK